MIADQPGQRPRFDTSVASIARIYDYWRPGPGGPDSGRNLAAYGGVGRKP